MSLVPNQTSRTTGQWWSPEAMREGAGLTLIKEFRVRKRLNRVALRKDLASCFCRFPRALAFMHFEINNHNEESNLILFSRSAHIRKGSKSEYP